MPAPGAAGRRRGRRRPRPPAAALAALGAAPLGLLLLIVAPLALVSSGRRRLGADHRGRRSRPRSCPSSTRPRASIGVNGYLLASIADAGADFRHPTTYGGPSTRPAASAARCRCASAAPAATLGAPPSTPTAAGSGPPDYPLHDGAAPRRLDSFDTVMAAAVHLRGKVGGADRRPSTAPRTRRCAATTAPCRTASPATTPPTSSRAPARGSAGAGTHQRSARDGR